MAESTVAGLGPALPAYRAAIDRARQGADGPAESGAGFGALLGQVLAEASEAGRHGEAVAMQALAGKASLQEVVAAVPAAELGLETVTAVRDRVIAAYQEIMRMPI